MANSRVSLIIRGLGLILSCLAQTFPGDKCALSSGREGNCKVFGECPIVKTELKKGIMPVTCGFEKAIPIVCCPNIEESTAISPNSAPPNETGQRANYWCQKYLEECPERHSIAGGEKALPKEFPHMAAIGYGDESNIKWSCGGTLISEKFILTAAHCLTSADGPPRWVLLGSELLINNINWTSAEGRKGQTHRVIRGIRHPEYKKPSKYHDIALLEIGAAVTPNAMPTVGRYLHPACLPTRNRKYELQKAIATGWGRTGHGEDGSPELLKVSLDIFELSKCNETFEVEIRTTKWLNRGIDETMLCAGILEGGMDTCPGDSGGPLQFAIRNACMFEVWGITSFGKACAFANSPAVYMRVSEYVPWIESVVWPEKK